ncbi:MAG: tripartite tricarboxylate transporter TctB family protein [Xanthobacteraceae bacterium]
MALGERPETSRAAVAQVLARKDVLAGLLFVGVALLGLWLSRGYPIGTALRMGTGYVPRLLCWMLLGLGAVILVQGARAALASEASGQRGHSIVRAPDTRPEPGSSAREVQDARTPSSSEVSAWRPVVFVTASLVIFGLSIERLGLVVSILLLVGAGALATRSLRLFETLAAALVLIVLSWGIFILGLGLTIPVWPEW